MTNIESEKKWENESFLPKGHYFHNSIIKLSRQTATFWEVRRKDTFSVRNWPAENHLSHIKEM